jgi:small-conductance mechanosensitive channel
MQMTDLIGQFGSWANLHKLELVISMLIIVLYIVSRQLVKRLIIRRANRHDAHKSRILYVTKVTNIAITVVFGALLGFIWEISLSGLSFYFASIFTVVGVGLFATWSLLSNVTASVILFFFFPFKVGSSIKVQDGVNSIEGVILDITMFYIEIETPEGNVVAFPNNVAIQKAFIVNKNTAE